MVMTSFPKQAYGFFTEEMDGETVLYRLGAHKAIHLNETAAVIWKLSDGSRTVAQLIDFIRSEYPDASDDIGPDVQRAVEQLKHEGAILYVEN